MIVFYLLASVLVLVALGVMVRGVLGGRREHAVANDLRTANIAIARDRLAALERSRASGAIEAADYDDERARIEARLADELGGDGDRRQSSAAAFGLIGLIVVAVPVAAAALYMNLGTPQAILARAQAPTPDATGDPDNASAPAPAPAPALANLVPRLEERLAEQPDDVMGWRLLGRTFIGMEEFGRAVAPLQRALELEPGDAGTHTQLAEARAMLAGGDLNGEALASLERAYALDPVHEQTLWLLGVARQQAGRHEEAIGILDTLRGIAAAAGNTDAVTTIDEYLGVSRQASGIQDTGEPRVAPSVEGASITVSVSLGADAMAATTADQTVFVYARAVDGPPMPLAVQRLSVADLPVTLTLDESMAMLPSATLAGFADVMVGARVSLSGQPSPSTGDWSIEVPATLGEDGTEAAPLALRIVTQLP